MSYKRLGDYIKRVSIKNSDGLVEILYGINIDKFFMPSVANVIGTDLSRYKVVTKNQFACNRMHVGRDKRLPISLSLEKYDFIVSPAYDVFEITDPDIISYEYLMMWFTREEFDRNCWFHTDSDVRGKLDWDAFMDMELPIPSIENQQQMVAEYNTVTNRINLNNELNQKLEETAQALYKHWFVDFEFPYDYAQGKPNAENKPYKSSGGEMVYNEELEKDIPVGWSVERLNKTANILNKKRKPISGIDRKEIQGIYPYYGAMGAVDRINDYVFEGTYLLVSEDGVYVTDKNGNPSTQYVWGKFWVNNHAHILQGKKYISTEYLMLSLKNTNVTHLVTGAAQPKINLGNLSTIFIQVPHIELSLRINQILDKTYAQFKLQKDETETLQELQSLLLAKMTQEETKLQAV
jgi:type I restriction enzyme S subunit